MTAPDSVAEHRKDQRGRGSRKPNDEPTGSAYPLSRPGTARGSTLRLAGAVRRRGELRVHPLALRLRQTDERRQRRLDGRLPRLHRAEPGLGLAAVEGGLEFQLFRPQLEVDLALVVDESCRADGHRFTWTMHRRSAQTSGP